MNDANYALRALLALLEMDSGTALKVVGRVAREGVPVAAPGLVDERAAGDDNMGLSGTCWGEHCEV